MCSNQTHNDSLQTGSTSVSQACVLCTRIHEELRISLDCKQINPISSHKSFPFPKDIPLTQQDHNQLYQNTTKSSSPLD